MVDASAIKWGRYKDYEGPFYCGNQPFVLPPNPSLEQCYLDVITATEGGSYNAINMYDRCGVSVGLIQWCEFGQFSVSALLHDCTDFADMTAADELLEKFNVSLVRVGSDGWRLSHDKLGLIDTISKQRRLFFLHASGAFGSWDDESKSHAKTWAAALATLFEDEQAKRVQTTYTTDRLSHFVLKAARSLWTSAPIPVLQTSWGVAAYAAYLSFAANNPTIASNMLRAYAENNGVKPAERDWVIGLLKQLTFGPNFSIYPARYNAIRPRLEKHFGVDLPDFEAELRTWQREFYITPSDPDSYRLDTAKALQIALLALGFDLGPAGADGVFGRKTREAVMAFQMQNELEADGIVGPRTRMALQRVLESRGL